MIIAIVRLALSASILYLVYGETGPVTTLAIALAMIGAEVTTIHVKMLSKRVLSLDSLFTTRSRHE